MSKKALTLSVYADLMKENSKAPLARKEVLSALETQVGISKACASTYLSNIRSGKWTDEPSAKVKVAKPASPRVTIEVISKMSNKELVAVFNKKAEKPVVRFRDRATGLRRVTDLYELA